MNKSLLEICDAWAMAAQVCENLTIRDTPSGRLHVARFTRERNVLGLCSVLSTLFDLHKIRYSTWKEMDRHVDAYGAAHPERYGFRRIYFWPQTKEGWEARRQFCLEQERLCQTHGPLAWRT